MNSLKRVLLHPSSPPVCPAPAHPLPSKMPSSSSPIVFASPMARPAPFTDSAEECNGFLLQCTLTIDLHPQMFPTDQSKIAFLITSLTGPALQWAETILNQAGPATQTFSHFLAHFREVFGSSPGDSSVGEQLFQLRQGTMPIHQYSLKFRTLAAASGWNEPSLLTAFRQGLNSRLRLQLAAYDDTYGLEKFIQLAIRCSNRLQSCSAESSVAIATPPIHHPEISDPPEPMQTDYKRLSSTERRRRLTEGLCLYCGTSGHRILECPLSSSSGVGEYHTASHYQDESSIHLRSAHCWRFCQSSRGYHFLPPSLQYQGTPKIPRIFQFLSPVHLQLQHNHQSPHRLIKREDQITSLEP